jgi:fructose-1,6-bisphosphatase/sedoheptulose 1,7-bisphosphatase-like protein
VSIDELARRQNLAQVATGVAKRLQDLREIVQLQKRHLCEIKDIFKYDYGHLKQA